MSIKVQIQDETTGDEPHVYDWFRPDAAASEGGLAFSTIDPRQIWTEFRAASRSAAGTTNIVTPVAGGSIILTDLILGTDRANNATVTIRFSDGIRSVNIYSGVTTDAPINIALSFNGRVRGWQDASLQLVTTGAVVANATAVYFKSEQGLLYDKWNFNR